MCSTSLFSSQAFTYHCTLTVWIWVHGTMENRDALPSSGSQGYWMSKTQNAWFDAVYLFPKDNVSLCDVTGQSEKGYREPYPEHHRAHSRVWLSYVWRVSYSFCNNQLVSCLRKDSSRFMLVNDSQALIQCLAVFMCVYNVNVLPDFLSGDVKGQALHIRIWRRKRFILNWNLKYLSLCSCSVMFMSSHMRGARRRFSVPEAPVPLQS